jgi:hypothetical protein
MMTFFIKAFILISAVVIVTPLVFLTLAGTIGRFFGLTLEADSIAQGWKSHLASWIKRS